MSVGLVVVVVVLVLVLVVVVVVVVVPLAVALVLALVLVVVVPWQNRKKRVEQRFRQLAVDGGNHASLTDLNYPKLWSRNPRPLR